MHYFNSFNTAFTFISSYQARGNKLFNNAIGECIGLGARLQEFGRDFVIGDEVDEPYPWHLDEPEGDVGSAIGKDAIDDRCWNLRCPLMGENEL